MALVRVRKGDVEFNVGASLAEAQGLNVLDEPTHGADGRPRAATRKNGRPRKPQTSVAEAAEKKKAAGTTSADQTEKEN